MLKDAIDARDHKVASREIYMDNAYAYSKAQEHDLAIEEAMKAYELDPENEMTISGLRNCLIKANRLEEAEHFAKIGLALVKSKLEDHPFIIGFYDDLGDIYDAQKKYDDAIKAYRNAIRAAQFSWTTDKYHLKVAKTCQKAGYYKRAISYAEGAMSRARIGGENYNEAEALIDGCSRVLKIKMEVDGEDGEEPDEKNNKNEKDAIKEELLLFMNDYLD